MSSEKSEKLDDSPFSEELTEMKRPDPVAGNYVSHNYVTVIPVDYPPTESPSITGNATRREESRHLPRDYSCPENTGHAPSHGLVGGTQPWYNNRPGTRCSVSSIHSCNEWTTRATDRGSQTSNAKKQDLCVLLMNKVGLCLEVDSVFQVSTLELLDMIFNDEQEIALPPIAREIFTLWMISKNLELQLKPHHKPYNLRQQWEEMLAKYSTTVTEPEEPVLVFKRNVFFDKKEEMRITDMKILELLYEEAKWNILEGRYVCRNEDCEMLAGIQAKLELESYERDVHTPDFFKNRITEFLPEYACRTSWNLLGFGPKVGAEHRVLEQFKSIPSKTTSYKLLRKYLEFCWALPFYGSAFFPGQIERPAKGFAMLLNHYDQPILVGINREGVHLIDQGDHSVILSLKYKDFSWDYACPAKPESPTCFPCIFLQFRVQGMNKRESNLLQVFSKQAKFMDILISSFVDELKQRPSWSEDEVDGVGLTSPFHDDNEFGVPPTPIKVRSEALLASKLNRLSLATFNDSGVCLKRTGSWAFRK